MEPAGSMFMLMRDKLRGATIENVSGDVRRIGSETEAVTSIVMRVRTAEGEELILEVDCDDPNEDLLVCLRTPYPGASA